MVKLKWIKDWRERKIGDISNVAEKSAENFVNQGYAKYVKEKFKKIEVKSKKELTRIKIPKRLQNKGFNFVLIDMKKGDGKKPKELGWQKKIIRFDSPQLLEHLKSGGNYGVQSNNSSIVINEEPYFLIIIDFDKRELQDKVLNKFPETLTTTSNSPKKCVHLWLASDDNKSFKIKDKELETLADVIGAGNQVIAPGSKHISGSEYEFVKDVPIAFMPYAEIKALLSPFDKSPKKIKKESKKYVPKGISEDFLDKIVRSISMENCLQELNIDTSKNPTECPFHSSNGGKCFSYDDEKAHCFHCDGSWNKYSLIREGKKLTDKDTFEWFAEKTGFTEELQKSREKYVKEKYTKKKELENVEGGQILTRRGQIESFWEYQPFFYDKSKLFWLWNKEEKKWVRSDEIDFLNSIQESLGIDTIDSKAKSELISGFQQIGRKKCPKDMEKHWVQFKDMIHDIKNGDSFKATPEYFITNPIPHNIGKSDETPTIDKLFTEWVGEEYKQTLYEIMAYNISLDKFMQRIIALCGGGSNGKGTFIKLNYRFLGKDNYVSSEIKTLSENVFEAAVLYRKLLCVMGEVSYDDLKNTNQLKKLGGEDLISFQFKGKTPFTDENTATCICATNSLPATPDKSVGFYRKWLIVDFPNQFKEISKDLIETIPEEEFENLSKKCLNILKDLYKSKKFTNEGSFEERIKRYEERSNPVMKFVEEHCEEEINFNTPIRGFTNECNKYLKSKHLRVLTANQIGKILRNEGFMVGNRKIDDISSVVVLNLMIKSKKNYPNYQNYENPHLSSICNSLRDIDSSSSSNSNKKKEEEKIEEVKVK